MLFLLGVLDEGRRDGSVILDEPSVVTAFTQEGP